MILENLLLTKLSVSKPPEGIAIGVETHNILLIKKGSEYQCNNLSNLLYQLKAKLSTEDKDYLTYLIIHTSCNNDKPIHYLFIRLLNSLPEDHLCRLLYQIYQLDQSKLDHIYVHADGQGLHHLINIIETHYGLIGSNLVNEHRNQILSENGQHNDPVALAGTINDCRRFIAIEDQKFVDEIIQQLTDLEDYEDDEDDKDDLVDRILNEFFHRTAIRDYNRIKLYWSNGNKVSRQTYIVETSKLLNNIGVITDLTQIVVGYL